MSLVGKKALVKVSGSALTLTGEVTNTTDNKAYQITNAAKRVLSRTAAITVKENGVTTSERYTIDRLTGTIIFETVNETRGAITVDGEYLPMSQAAEANEYSLSLEGEMLEDTSFQDNWKTFAQGLKSASGTISQWQTIDTYFSDALVAGEPVVIEIYPNGTTEPFILWAILDSDEMQAAVAELQNESVSFASTERMITP